VRASHQPGPSGEEFRRLDSPDGTLLFVRGHGLLPPDSAVWLHLG
jgi:hypothetical protein